MTPTHPIREAGALRSDRDHRGRSLGTARARAYMVALLGLTGATLVDLAEAKQGPGDRWAAVKADGTLLSSDGAVGVSHPPGTNTYVVSFDRIVADCIYLATLSSASGMVTTALFVADPTGIFVSTYNRQGTEIARDFALHVVCD